jgi:thiamine-monophosphate kinase
LLLHERYELHAAIDISDGLALDASRLAAESGCGAVVFTDRVPVSADAGRLAEQERAVDRGAAALQHALGDGQDFELLVAAAPETARAILRDRPLKCGVTHVGELVADRGLWRQEQGGERKVMDAVGWVHRAEPQAGDEAAG